MGFSGVSLGSLLMIGFVGLIFFGPSKLKSIAKDLGEALAEFKQGLEQLEEKSSKKIQDNNLKN
ncbi:twin-arginine translocase TatA/TatE family subunit [bacterium]|jgi:TatA/E family protein of Tat protein translocase|nr:twin-arginine translocase TatA/TatE family subunit [bacterium]NBX72559.1 twin-arginine translocase TatA/TatE family subunit [bacterium]